MRECENLNLRLIFLDFQRNTKSTANVTEEYTNKANNEVKSKVKIKKRGYRTGGWPEQSLQRAVVGLISVSSMGDTNNDVSRAQPVGRSSKHIASSGISSEIKIGTLMDGSEARQPLLLASFPLLTNP